MARVRLTALGFESFTGNLGKVRFVDGLSEEITPAQAAVVGAAYSSILVEGEGDDETEIGSASPAEQLAQNATTRVSAPRNIDAPAHQLRLDAEPFYIKRVTFSEYTITQEDLGYLLDFTDAAIVTVPAGLKDDFYCSLRQGGENQIEVQAEPGVTVEEIDGFMKSEKRLAILNLARFPDGSFQITGRTAA